MAYFQYKLSEYFTIAYLNELVQLLNDEHEKLALRTFDGSTNPSISKNDEYAKKHWFPNKKGETGFNQLIRNCEQRNLEKFQFKFFDGYDNKKFLEIEINCKINRMNINSSYDNNEKVCELLQRVIKCFKFEEEPTLIEFINGKKVFVIFGRNTHLRDKLYSFLKNLGLTPIDWEMAIKKTSAGTPYPGDILDVAFNEAQCVLALHTPDEFVELKSEFSKSEEAEKGEQPRPNVIFETGMALAKWPKRTIIIEFGNLRPFSDILGRYSVKFQDTFDNFEKQKELVHRMYKAGCEFDCKQKEKYQLS